MSMCVYVCVCAHGWIFVCEFTVCVFSHFIMHKLLPVDIAAIIQFIFLLVATSFIPSPSPHSLFLCWCSPISFCISRGSLPFAQPFASCLLFTLALLLSFHSHSLRPLDRRAQELLLPTFHFFLSPI